MWIVRIALSRPYTFVVFAFLLIILGFLAILRTPTDIFPNINIPVVSVVWSYTGLPPNEMANRITSYFERAATTTVNDIEHIESNSLLGVSVTKIFFRPSVNIAVALSQVTAVSQSILRFLPPGTTPPLILSYKAATVPVIQLVLSSETFSEQNINDLANNFIRPQLATVQGASSPFAYGGKIRQIQVDLNPQAMQAHSVSAQDVNTAIGLQNLIIPAGTQKIGQYEYVVKLNASPLTVDELNDLPIRWANGALLYVRDVAHVRDGSPPQTNIVRVNTKRAVLMPIQKTGNASTLDIINRIKDLLPQIEANLPEELKLTVFGDQSLFVTAAIKGVVIEGLIAALLTGCMILLFLGSWRSTFIITLSIPLSILASLILLSALGETINIMTLGGLALAVGILVDDATVAIENINWNIEQGKEVTQAILDSGEQIALPAFVSTLCICIVFIPMFYLGGVAYYLFVPFAEAVVFAMLASYFLSRTLVATLANYLLPTSNQPPSYVSRSFGHFHHVFSDKFEKLRHHYHGLLNEVLHHSGAFILIFLAFLLLTFLFIFPWLGSDFFPSVDAGQIKLHVRAPTGMRVEETAKLCDEIEKKIRKLIPAKELESIVDNIGVPVSGINLAYSNSATSGPEDADILISLQKNHHATESYIHTLRRELLNGFPGVAFAFLPADIVNQILNFGLPSPINLQVIGTKFDLNRNYANQLLEKVKHVPGIVDARIRQAFNYPQLLMTVDRSFARELGLTQYDVATSMLIALSGSFQTSPTFWMDPKNGVSYPIVTQVSQYDLNSLQALRNLPITGKDSTGNYQILGALGTLKRGVGPSVVSHYNIQPVIDIFASIHDRDLGSIAKDINNLITKTKNDIPKGTQVIARGQMETQHNAFTGLYYGLLFSIVLVYLLMVVNFQSWLDPFIIITALPAALAGITWMLFFTHTPLSVPALTGAIMCIGVATANSILVVSFARENLREGKKVIPATLDSAIIRMRPVLMTALAMIIGMVPMALGLGEGGEQNAPLGRAVIGGLLFATVATLFFVPAVFCLIHGRRESEPAKEEK